MEKKRKIKLKVIKKYFKENKNVPIKVQYKKLLEKEGLTNEEIMIKKFLEDTHGDEING